MMLEINKQVAEAVSQGLSREALKFNGLALQPIEILKEGWVSSA